MTQETAAAPKDDGGDDAAREAAMADLPPIRASVIGLLGVIPGALLWKATEAYIPYGVGLVFLPVGWYVGQNLMFWRWRRSRR